MEISEFMWFDQRYERKLGIPTGQMTFVNTLQKFNWQTDFDESTTRK